MESPERGKSKGRSGRRSECAQLTGSECPSWYDITLGVVEFAVQVRVERSRLSAPVGIATARERRFRSETIGEASTARENRARLETIGEASMARESRARSEMNGEASMARESRDKSETTGDALMARESRDRSEKSGEALMARESRPKSETMEDAGEAVMKRGQSSGIGNCSVSPAENSPSRVQPRGRRSPSRAPRLGPNLSCGHRTGATSPSHSSPGSGCDGDGHREPG